MTRLYGFLGLVGLLAVLVTSDSLAVGEEKQAAARNYEVRMTNNKFDQKDIQIAVGDSVSWLNDDDTKHSVTTEAGSDLMMPEIIVQASEHSSRIKFDKAGVFK